MNFTTSYTDDLRLAHILADNVDRVSMSRFKDRSFTVEHKSDGTPVTEVDREVEELLRAQLSRVRTRDGIIGEELGSTGTAARQWVIDPIDGTQNFVRGVPVWATLIALLDQGEPVMGLVSAPALQRRWWAAQGTGAYAGKSLTQATRLQVSSVPTVSGASLSYAEFKGWEGLGLEQSFLSLVHEVNRSRAYGDFWSYCLVAEGAVDIACEAQVALHDIAALVPLVHEAGGTFTTAAGDDAAATAQAEGTASTLATNGTLHRSVISQLTPE